MSPTLSCVLMLWKGGTDGLSGDIERLHCRRDGDQQPAIVLMRCGDLPSIALGNGPSFRDDPIACRADGTSSGLAVTQRWQQRCRWTALGGYQEVHADLRRRADGTHTGIMYDLIVATCTNNQEIFTI